MAKTKRHQKKQKNSSNKLKSSLDDFLSGFIKIFFIVMILIIPVWIVWSIHPALGILFIAISFLIVYRYFMGSFRWPQFFHTTLGWFRSVKSGRNTQALSQRSQSSRPTGLYGGGDTVKTPSEIHYDWQTAKEAYKSNDIHNFLNFMGTAIDQALRFAYLKRFGKNLTAGAALSALAKKGIFKYPKKQIKKVWKIRNSYVHSKKVLNTDVERLSQTILDQIFEVAHNIIECCLPRS